MKPGTSQPKRETAQEFRTRVAREMRDEIKRLDAQAKRAEARAKKARETAEALKNSATVLSKNGR